jgi:hypothetical protein
MDDIRATAETDIQASQDRMTAAITALDNTLATAMGNSATATDQANTDYNIAKTNLETLISTSLSGTVEETKVIEAKWTSEMAGMLDFQTQWQLDHEARILSINDEKDLELANAAIVEKDKEQKFTDLAAAYQKLLDEVNKPSTVQHMTSGEANAALAAGTITEEDLKSGKVIVQPENVVGDWILNWLKSIPGIMFGGAQAEGSIGMTSGPTLFLAGERESEPYAFGKYATQGMQGSGALVLHNYFTGPFLGTPQDAEAFANLIAPALRRKMIANTGKADW